MQPLFLLSLPRSGSTLLQRMLGAHSQVATASEPWILLPLLYGRRHPGVHAEYDHRRAVKGIEDFVDTLDGGESAYRDEVRAHITALYTRAGGDATYFLDKTPRYSLVADELVATFPDAPLIVLWRNPLAVVASIIDTWLDRFMPQLHAVDLYTGLANLVDLVAAGHPSLITVRYEDLVTDPDPVIGRVLDHLQLPPEPNAVRDLDRTQLSGRLGDRWGAEAYSSVSTDPLQKWQATLSGRVRKAWALRYLSWLGADRLALMGYDLADLSDQVRGLPDDLSLRDAADLVRGEVVVRLEPHRLREKATRQPRPTRRHYHT